MQIHRWLFPALVMVALVDLVKAQTTPEYPGLLPPVYTESGVELDLEAEADSVITFTDALQLVVTRHPQVEAAKAQIAAAQGRLQQSHVRPNPELSTEVEDFGRSYETGPAQTTIGVEQSFELFGKRRARRDVAEAELASERFAAQLSLLQLYRTVAVNYATVLGAQENVTLAQKRLELARRVEEAVSLRVSGGGVPKVESFRAQSATKMAELDLSSAEAAATQGRLALATQWGSSTTDFLVDGSLDEWLTLPPGSEQTVQVDDNPELTSLQAQLRAREADIRLAQATGKPDLSLGAGYRRLHDDGSNSFLVWAAAPLPLFDRNRGGVAEANARLTQTEAELAAARQRLTGEARQLLAVIETQRQRIDLLREQVIPPAKQAMEEMDLAYRLGSQPYINVLDAQRTLSELHGMLIDARIAGAQATAEIEQLTGHRLHPTRR